MKRENKPLSPGAWRPTREFLKFIEEHATIIRRRAKVGPLDKLDPHSLVKKLGVKVVNIDELTALTPADREQLANIDPKTWSGGGLPMPNGKYLVILHPQQTPERANVTLMEEVCHAYFGHKPSQLIKQLSGITKREYDPQAEREAYWTAGAALLPSEVVAKAVWRRQSAEELAEEYGVSVELAVMRIKTLGLWDDYLGQRRKAS